MFYDVHVHLDKKYNNYRHYVTIARKNGIVKAVVFPFPCEKINRVAEANEYIVNAFQNNRELFIPFFLITNDGLNNIRSDIIMGFKEHFISGTHENFFFPAYEFLQDNELFLLIHPGSKKKISPEKLINLKIRKIKNIKKNFPRLKIILAHSGRNLPFHGKGVKELASALKQYEDIYFETSTIRTPKAIKEIVETVGSRRVLFGSDYPYYKRKDEDIYTLEKDTILKTDIPDAAKEDIFQNNFRRLFLKDFWVRRSFNEDINKIITLIEDLPELDKKHLAITQKIDKIKECIIHGKHMYILENKQGEVIGFIRVSDRHCNGALIEEIVIKQGYRGMGLSKILMEAIINKYSYLEAKTFTDNHAVNKLNEKFGFRVVKKSKKGNILYWKKEKCEKVEGDTNA